MPKTGTLLRAAIWKCFSVQLPKEHCVWERSQSSPILVLLIRVTCRWIWVWCIGGNDTKTEVLGERSALTSLGPPQISHGLTWDRTIVSAVGGRRLTAWGTAMNNTLYVKVEVVPLREQIRCSSFIKTNRCRKMICTHTLIYHQWHNYSHVKGLLVSACLHSIVTAFYAWCYHTVVLHKRSFETLGTACTRLIVGRDSVVGVETRYGLEGSGIESPWGRDFPHRPWSLPSILYNVYRVSFPGVKRPGRGANHPLPSNAEVKGRIELYLYSPSGPSWPVVGRISN